MFGLCVHFKIYPVLYALPFYFYIDRPMGATQRRLTEKVRSNPRLAVLPVFLRAPFFSRNRLIFTFVSAGVFISLTGVFYALYGYEFLHEGYIYHVTRKDNRHNFSLFFYYIYLSFETLTKVQSLLTFLP